MIIRRLVSLLLQEVMIVVQVTVNVDLGGLSEKLSQFPEAKTKGMEYATQEMVRTLMMNSPVDHGLLKSWFIESMTEDEAHIKTPADYALEVNYGTRPHFIYPSNKKMLYWEGAEHPVPFVVHPGTSPTLFIENSIEDVEGRLDGYFLKALEEVMG